MNIKKLLVVILSILFCTGLILPTAVFAAKGSNDFTATLSVSDTLVPEGTWVDCTITIKNTDPTYGADMSVHTSGGLLLDSFYLGAGQTTTVNQNLYITETTDIYYRVYASHGPDISKTKYTNTVRVNIEEEPDGGTGATPVPEVIAETPETEPVHGVPKSGSVFVAYIDNVVYDGIFIGDDGERIISNFDDPAVMTGEIHYHLPDSIAVDYFDRDPADYVTLSAHWHMTGDSAAGMDEIVEGYTLTEDDGIIEFEQLLTFNDLPILTDEIPDYIYLNIRMYDPVEDTASMDYVWVEVNNGPSPDDGYTVMMGETFLDGVIISPDDVIEVEYGEDFTIQQNIVYTVPEDELTLEDRYRTSIIANCMIDSEMPMFVRAPQLEAIPVSTIGLMEFQIAADATSFSSDRLSMGTHTIEIFAFGERDLLPGIDSRDSVTLTINVVGDGPVDWGERAEDDAGIEMFDGTFFMDPFRWLGLGDSIDLIPQLETITVAAPGYYELIGRITTSGPESYTVRLYGSGDFGEPLELSRFTPEGECGYNIPVHVTETTEFELTAELVDDIGEVLAADTETVTIIVMEDEPDYRIRYSLTSAPTVIGMGEDTTLYYSLSNEFSGETLHVRLIDEADGSVIFEDETFEHFEIYDGFIMKSPTLPTMYRFTVQVIGEGGAILYEYTKEQYVIVMPNPAGDDGEEIVFNLELGASADTIAPGETVRIYGAIDYGSFAPLEIIGEVEVTVTDQEGHVLYLNAGAMPGDVMGFAEEYVLDETTTFTITAVGNEVAGDRVVEDTDEITITVTAPEDEPPADEEEPIHEMGFAVHASETVIAPGESVDIDAILVNFGTELVTCAVYDESGDFFGGIAGALHPSEAMGGMETRTFDETTTIALQGVAWVGGSIVVFNETLYLTIVVDPTLAEDAAEDPIDDGRYDLDYNLIAREMTIYRGETTDVYIDVMNVGTETVDIRVSEPAEGVLFEGHDIAGGTRFDNVIHWGPTATSVLTILVEALDESGAVVYSETQAVTVTVADPPVSELGIELTAAVTNTFVEIGDTVDFTIDVTNTGEETIDHYVLTESLLGTSLVGLDLWPTTTESHRIIDWIIHSDTTAVFEVRAYNSRDELIASDMVSVTVEIDELIMEPFEVVPEDEEPREDAFDDGADAPDDSSDSSESPSGSADDAEDTAAGDGADDIFDGGMELSLEELTDADGIARGELTIISSSPEDNEERERIYNIRRIFIALTILVIILLILLIILIASNSKRKRQRAEPKADGFDDLL